MFGLVIIWLVGFAGLAPSKASRLQNIQVNKTVFKLYKICKYLYGLLRLRSMLRPRFVMLALSKASERLNK